MAELRLWREATTVFTTSGHGGCEAFGLALAAHRRGSRVTVLLSSDDYAFLDGVRSAEKKRVMRLVQEDFPRPGGGDRHRGGPRTGHPRRADRRDRPRRRGAGADQPLADVMPRRCRHWVVVHGHDARFVYRPRTRSSIPTSSTPPTAKAHLPIPHWEFERMARYGRARLSAAVVVERRAAP